jgi:hypothetical protein
MEETIMRGRYPSGPEYVDSVPGSAEAKERAKIILRTLLGELRVQQACTALRICPQRFQQLRAEMLPAAVARLETRPGGRPRRPAEAATTAALREQLAQMQQELRLAQVREEIALALPQVVVTSAAAAAEPEKKTTRRPRRRPPPGWSQK